MIRILMVGPNLNSKGGISFVVKNYFRKESPNGFEIFYISTAKDGKAIFKIIEFLKGFIKILYFLFFKKIDIIHVHMASYFSFARKSLVIVVSKVLKKKVIIHLHGGKFDVFYKKSNKLIKIFIRYVFSLSDLVIILGNEWYEKAKSFGAKRIKILPNAVECPESNYYFDKQPKFYITFLGRIAQRKGIYDIVEIAKDIIVNYPSIKFFAAGDGEILYLKELLKEKNLKNNFEVSNWIDEKKKDEILRRTIIFLLPSYHEGLPMALLEAMSYGIPVITTNVGAIPTLIKNGINGLIIEPGDKIKLKENILYLLSNEEIRIKMSQAAYETIKNGFDLNNHIEKLIEIYKQLVSLGR